MSMTIPTVPALPAGYVVQLADLQNLASAATFSLTKPVARVLDETGGQAIPAAGSLVPSFDTVIYDPDGMWASAHKGRLTAQTPGWYKVRYMVNCGTGGGVYQSWIGSTTGPNNPAGAGVNSAAYWGGYSNAGLTTTTARPAGSGIWPFYLYAGDYLQVNVVASGAGSNTAVTSPGAYTLGGSFFAVEYVSTY